MADLQSMTLQERMNTINNAEFTRTDNINDTTLQEACNRFMKLTGTINSVDYSGIGLNDYTPEEAFAIIRHKTNVRSKDLTELINEMGPYGAHDYTATEALNKKDDVVVGTGT